MIKTMHSFKYGFTLVELLVVIAVIGALISLLLPAIQSSRDSGRKVSCANNLKQIGTALESYQASNQAYPPSTDHDLSRHWSTLEQHSWASMILPYLEQNSLYESIDFSAPLDDPTNRTAAATIVSTYRCPAYTGPEFSEFRDYPEKYNYAIGNYVALSAVDIGHIWDEQFEPEGVIFPLSAIKPKDVTDGLSNTVLIVESREEKMRVWMDGLSAGYTALYYENTNYPTHAGAGHSLNYSPYYPNAQYGPSSNHPGGAYHLLGDGSVRFIRNEIAKDTYAAYCTREGNELVSQGND